MKRTELILSLVAFAGVLLKLIIIPGGALFTVLGLSGLSILYFYLSFAIFNRIPLRQVFKKQSYSGISAKHLLGSTGTGLALSLLLMGILFKLQFWPGANTNIAIGLFWSLCILVVSLVKLSGSHAVYYRMICRRVSVLSLVGIALWLTPSRILFGFFHRDHPAYVQAMIRSWENPGDADLQKEVEDEYEKMSTEHEH